MRRRSLSAFTSEKSSSPSGRIAFQHWVSKFLVKNFADRDGRVFCLDIHTDQFTKPAPRQAASEKGFNHFKVYGEEPSPCCGELMRGLDFSHGSE